MRFPVRRSQSAPDVTSTSMPAEPAAPPPRPSRSAGDVFKLARRSAPAVPAAAHPASLAPARSASDRQEAACLDRLSAAAQRDPRSDFYGYLAACRDGVHAVRDFMLHSAWRQPERVAALLKQLPAPQSLSPSQAGTLTGVLYCAILEVATAKAERSLALPRHRQRLTLASQRQVQRLVNEVQGALRGLFAADPSRLRQLATLAQIPFDEDAEPEMLRSVVKSQLHTLSVVEGQVQGFFHPMASLAHACFEHFEPNADLNAFSAPPTLPPATARTAAAQALAGEIADAVYDLNLQGRLLAPDETQEERLPADPLATDIGPVSRLTGKILALLQAHAGEHRWAVASELCRALRSPKVGDWTDKQRLLMATLVHGAALRYAAQYLHQRHFENTRGHLAALGQALGDEMHAWTADPRCRSQLDVVSGLVQAGFQKRMSPLQIASNLGSYGLLLRKYPEPRPELNNFGQSPAHELLSKPLERVLLGVIKYKVEDLPPLHPSNAHRRDAF